MWILDSLSQVELKKPFIILWIALGAVFLLLAHFFAANPLYNPATYCVLATVVWALWQKERSIRNGLVVALLSVAAYQVVPNFLIAYTILFALSIGKVVFAENFRMWKAFASSVLLLLAVPIVSSWQGIPAIHSWIPDPVAQLIYAAVFAFCVQFSLLAYQLRKDSVIEAFSNYPWKTSSNAHHLASEMVALYTKIKTLIRKREKNPKILQDLEDYTERALHQCYRLQEISTELSTMSPGSIEQQIIFLNEKLNVTQDFATRMQYEQALVNKKKQREQYEKLQKHQEHLLSRILNYNSSLENVRFAYANQDWERSSSAADSTEMFMDLVKARAEAL